ncbi:MAG: motif family protein [Acidobacteriota bacterium]|jgi:Spy/CpxP family protein refolding chaperone|nr:motif family protein [Acidobacteriota bacterium]
MDRGNKYSWLVRAAAVVVFVLGFLAGALALSAYTSWRRPDARVSGQDHFERMSEHLQLSPEQKTQARRIFDDTRAQLQALRKESEPRFAEIRRQADERLQQVLTPEQWQQFQQMHDGRRGRHGGPGGDGAPSPDER